MHSGDSGRSPPGCPSYADCFGFFCHRSPRPWRTARGRAVPPGHTGLEPDQSSPAADQDIEKWAVGGACWCQAADPAAQWARLWGLAPDARPRCGMGLVQEMATGDSGASQRVTWPVFGYRDWKSTMRSTMSRIGMYRVQTRDRETAAITIA